MKGTSQETVDALKTARQAQDDSILKGFTQSGSAISGLTAYDLEAPAKMLYPTLTPLRNRIPRVSGKGGIQANWRAVTGINTTLLSAGVSGGDRGGVITHTTADYLAAYKGIGLEDFVTFEADYAAKGFDDVKVIATEGLLKSLMIQEESIILGGNTSVALGTTPTPTLVGSTTGGTLGTITLSVICVALAYDAFWAVGGFNNGFVGSSVSVASAVVPSLVTRTNADGSITSYGGGSAQKSAAASASITGNTGSCGASVTAVSGAVGYAWFWGLAGSEVLGAITSINSVSITATATGTQTAASMPSSDNSTNTYVCDGLISQISKSGSNAYVKALATGTPGTGTVLTSDNAGGITEINTAFAAFYDQYRLSPDTIYVNRQQQKDITNKIIAGGSAPLYRFEVNGNNPGGISAGTVIKSYLNPVTGTMVNIEVHPTMPAGTMVFYSDSIPYKLSNVSNVLQIRARQDYYQIEWPLRSRKWEYGVYADEVLQNYFPPAFGVITNIAAG